MLKPMDDPEVQRLLAGIRERIRLANASHMLTAAELLAQERAALRRQAIRLEDAWEEPAHDGK